MQNIIFGSTHSGGGLVDIGYKAAGMAPAFAVEYSPEIAEIYRANHGDHVKVCRVEDITRRDLPLLDVLHSSPMCTNVTNANPTAGETPDDLSQARAVAQLIEWGRPPVFTLENVRQYTPTVSFQLILSTLAGLNYHVQFKVVNSANYGVPQTRNRLILVATRPDMPWFEWPEETHHNGPLSISYTIFGPVQKLPWVGWLEAIGDLLPGFPELALAEWQTKLLPYHADRPILVNGVNSQNSTRVNFREIGQPGFTISATNSRHPFRASQPGGTARVITPRGLARFQSAPDSYRLSGKNILDCKILGNGVPCRLAEIFGRSIIQSVFGQEIHMEKIA
jgi:DNA (cytosine-5)-methyltransferase 1